MFVKTITCRKNLQFILWRYFSTPISTKVNVQNNAQDLHTIEIRGKTYERDEYTNISKKLTELFTRKLYKTKNHPLNLLTLRICDYFQTNYRNRYSSPLFAVVDNLSPVVTTGQNFDSLLIPDDHVSRKPSETYYVNKNHVLRSHTSAHEHDLISSGLDHFLVVGDVYRRDEIDGRHFPCFHQMEGVSLFTQQELFLTSDEKNSLKLFEKGEKTVQKQACHTFDCAQILQQYLKNTLEALAHHVFGEDVKCRWVDAYFPFTHPSFELEIFFHDHWIETLGCGVLQQELLNKAGADYKVGWAFGLGLERLAMKLYSIPDIRLFWSQDSAFLSQFETDDFNKTIVYKPISRFAKKFNDMAMWLPKNDEKYTVADFYDLVRNLGGDVIEQVELIDNFQHPTTKQRSHCYRITYRHMERFLPQTEISTVHNSIGDEAEKQFGVVIRR